MNGGKSDTGDVLFILLGASNLARACGGLASHLRRTLRPRRVRLLTALGPGRGYSHPGGVFNAVYPPIRSCGLFSACGASPPGHRRTVALVTDIGNDIMYGVPAEQLVADLSGVFEKLERLGADILVTPIPDHIENQLHPAAFKILRSVFYPNSRVSLDEARSAIRRVNGFLRQAAEPPRAEVPTCGEASESLRARKTRIRLINGVGVYAGLDHIHYSAWKMHRAWSVIAGEMLDVLGIPHARPIRSVRMLESIIIYLMRLFFCDMIPLRKKPHGFF